MRLGAIPVVLLVGCYNPAPQSGVQLCGPKGECEAGYYCAADNHCYKNGDKPKADASVQMDMAMPCTADTCKAMSKVCDPDTHACVDCLQDGDCPLGKVCKQKACVDGCTDTHGCPSGMCTNGMCSVCKANGDCANDPNGNKLCDVASGKCVACLVTGDCGAGQFCDPGDHTCHMGCDTDGQCTTDAGNANMKCCNHVCYDLNSSNTHCGDCNTDCGNQTCCGGFCSDITNGDINNCGGCGIACAKQNATWACMNSACTVTGCNMGFNNCNMLANDGCESNAASDVNNCGGCNMKCAPQNAMGACVNGSCGIGMCMAGFSDCNKQPNDGCEINTAGDTANCGGCGKACSLANAMPVCIGGMCGIGSCNNGFGDCNKITADGCEANTATDVNNCGGCMMPCAGVPNATPSCSGSKCVASCKAGFGDCDMNYIDGCEANFATDVNNCGGCAKPCAMKANTTAVKCASSACAVSTCAAGFADCNGQYADGCEINTNGDNNNCATCGHICGNGTTCVNGQCVVVMSQTFTANFTANMDGQASCAPWNTYRMALTGNYSSVNIKGTFDNVGFTCTNSGANEPNQIATNLRNGTAFSIVCGAHTWNVGTCGAGIELTASGPGVCQCQTPGYTMRPCINVGNANWGGANTATCTGPTQTITVTFN